MTPILWKHGTCGKNYYIDGKAFIYCECDQDGRCIFDARFKCGSDAEYYSFASYFDILTANATLLMSMTGSGLEREEREALNDWVMAMNLEITRRAKA